MSFAAPTKVFAYVDSEIAPLCRAIMGVFVESKKRFGIYLHLEDISRGIRWSEIPGQKEIESALLQLCEWGNLQMLADTTSVAAVEDFHNPRQTFRMTVEGEAAEKAFALFHLTAGTAEKLQGSGLSDIRSVIDDLQETSRTVSPDSGKIHRGLLTLRALFEHLCVAAETLIDKLECRDLQQRDAGSLIESGRRFMGELESEAEEISDAIRAMETAEFQDLLQAASERGNVEWSTFWDSFRNWFASHNSHIATVTRLRERVRTLLPGLIRDTATGRNTQKLRIDRANDFRILARWFAEADTDAEAHILWRTAFGLCPARHLIIDDATIADREARNIPAHTSWLDAPPLRISTGSRDNRGISRTGGLSRIIDRSEDKRKLAGVLHEEAQRLLNAQRRFGTGNRLRLSELEHLDAPEFGLLLDFLGDAMSARVSAAEPVEILSSDGCMKVRLESTGDDRQALILTADGVFTGPDQWLRIESISPVESREAVT